MINIKEQLKQLRTIEPDRDFAIRAKYAIIGNRDIRESSFSLPRFSFSRNAWALSGAGLTAILLLIIVAVPLAFPKPTLSASLSPETLIGEYGNLPINIQLKEITYEQTVSQTISSAISEVSDTKTSHLNSDLINSEAQKNASIDDTGAKNVDTLLNQVIN
ncbi:MAG: hypothetical protein NTZ36_00230 [Candidatus Jorgensenbacteria bacterium]|nr:hypothetical protein [Candidatus Jorgensenbacteria bacterium]